MISAAFTLLQCSLVGAIKVEQPPKTTRPRLPNTARSDIREIRLPFEVFGKLDEMAYELNYAYRYVPCVVRLLRAIAELDAEDLRNMLQDAGLLPHQDYDYSDIIEEEPPGKITQNAFKRIRHGDIDAEDIYEIS